ncbi:MAG TPA: hypothetical protein VF331_16230, partial [Polyangiales bacterium]
RCSSTRQIADAYALEYKRGVPRTRLLLRVPLTVIALAASLAFQLTACSGARPGAPAVAAGAGGSAAAGASGAGGGVGGVGGQTPAGLGGSDASATGAPDAGMVADSGHVFIGHGACVGTYQITTQSDLASIVECTTIDGEVHVDTDGDPADPITKIALPNLVSVGQLSIQSREGLSSLLLPKLTSAGKLIIAFNGALPAISLPELASVAGDVYIIGTNLYELRMPKLETVGGRCDIGGALRTLELGALRSVVLSASLGSDQALVLSLPALVSVGENLTLTTSAFLQSIELPKLQSIGGTFEITNNAALHDLTLPMIDDVAGDLTITGNHALPQCTAEAVRDKVAAGHFSGTATVTDNLGTCP